MASLTLVAPDFVQEVTRHLVARELGTLVEQLASAAIVCFTYETDGSAAYIYLGQPAPVAKTLVFYEEAGFNIDLNPAGQIVGIELLGRKDVIQAFRAQKGDEG